jgi:hypothetical protein
MKDTRTRTTAILTVLIVILFPANLCYSRTWHVPSEVATIPDAVDSASYGDTVLVAPGTYICPDNIDYSLEWVTLPSGVSLIGQGGAHSTVIIDLTTNQPHCLIQLEGVSDCLIEGFTSVREASVAGSFDAVCLYNVSNSFVDSCSFDKFMFGIDVWGQMGGSQDPRIRFCHFTRCGAGIYCSVVEPDDSPIIRFNTFVNNGWGIRCFDAGPYIVDNYISNSSWAGVYCYGRSPARLDRNTIVNNEHYGVWVDTEVFYEPYMTTAWLAQNGNSIYNNGDYDLYNTVDDQRGVVEARYTYWGSDCPDFERITGGPGRVNYLPWCDSTHTEEYDECPPHRTCPVSWGSIKALFK